MRIARITLQGILWAALCVLTINQAQAGNTYNESTSTDLSNNQAAPTSFSLTSGTNPVIGNVGAAVGDMQDWIAVSVPSGFQLSSLILHSYISNDVQGFTGFQAGSAFSGNPQTAPSAYEGYTHFGTAAQNGVLAAVNLVGQDLLPVMANPADAPGSQGFTPPLAAGTYTFLVQQSGASTSYEFDFGVTAVPEPASLGLMGLAGAALLAVAFRRRKQ
ncbi:MAG TPA: PEP-CTERM sorting domain-containing protein [Pirellulales bacterium]|jgi:hypothetical protein|nr:PEP-CTERM sorting domain-containing protein [Pirellulales bacterium]